MRAPTARRAGVTLGVGHVDSWDSGYGASAAPSESPKPAYCNSYKRCVASNLQSALAGGGAFGASCRPWQGGHAICEGRATGTAEGAQIPWSKGGRGAEYATAITLLGGSGHDSEIRDDGCPLWLDIVPRKYIPRRSFRLSGRQSFIDINQNRRGYSSSRTNKG